MNNLPEPLQADINHVGRISPFFLDLINKEPQLAAEAFDQIDERLDVVALTNRYLKHLEASADTELAQDLRRLRRQEMIRIVFRDITRRASTLETTAELSHLADFCIGQAVDHCYQEAVQKYGAPTVDGKAEQLIVIGMGKLGAFELNLSSDVDLIFFYSQQGQIDQGNGKQLTFQEFFLRLARRVIACLDDAGKVDSVFRVDMRLRPYGDSGPLVLHRAAMEKYYIEQGRDWERYAFIKARVVAGDVAAGEDFLEWMRPFVYRRHLDFGAIQSLREMKGLIARQIDLQQKNDDLKLGPGGIREIEFIAQAHQLIWGGRHIELQQRSLMLVLDHLAAGEFLPATDVEELKAAYEFLRNSEHAVQAEHDRQTHTLPVASESQERLALALGFESFDSYSEVLAQHRAAVNRCFDQLVAAGDDGSTPSVEERFTRAWADPVDEELKVFKAEINEAQLADAVYMVLDRLLPRLLQNCAGANDSILAQTRMLAAIRSVLRRSTYLIFLDENHDALSNAVELVTVSSWIAEQLESYPILLYALTDRALSEVSVTKLQLEGELREIMRAIDADDLETQMDTLRQFKLSATLKIAAMELQDKLSIMQASDGLTALAEVLLEASLDLAWGHLEAKHGIPHDNEGQPLSERLAIVAYGKAGGLELAYGSDLDLVFLGPNAISGNTDGQKSINNNVFYVRVGQRIIHILTSFTRFGKLYEADLRLRPQGNKGPMVATINAFGRYQEKEAWTWEHQALIRARFMAGDKSLGRQFDDIRRRVIETGRDQPALLADVISMREKMRVHLGSGARKRSEEGAEVLADFDLKHDAGAIVDIEFMVQYAVLGWASTYRALSRWTDVMRLLDELMQAEVVAEADADAMQRAYLAFRAAIHHGWLGLTTDFERLQSYRNEVHQIWNKTMLKE